MREFINFNITYKEVDGKVIKGRFLNVFVNSAVFSQIFVYEDGSIHYWGMAKNLNEIKDEIAKGFISAIPLQNDTILLPEIGSIQNFYFYGQKTNDDLIKEIEDTITELNGGKGRIQLLREAIQVFFYLPTEENWQSLKLIYENSQTNVRNTLLEMDSRKCPLINIMENKSLFIGKDLSHFIEEYIE